MDITGEQQFGKKGGITLKRVLACFVVLGVVVFALTGFSGMRREQAKEQCLVRLGNVNKALGLYRADFDGFSPAYLRPELIRHINKLDRYSTGRTLSCPYDSMFAAMAQRMAVGNKASSIGKLRSFSLYVPFGVEDTSVVLTCENHLAYKFRFEIPNTVWRTREQNPPTGGSYNILLRNGTAKSIPNSSHMQAWQSWNGEFKRPQDRPSSWKSYGNTLLFDFEPPPQFEY